MNSDTDIPDSADSMSDLMGTREVRVAIASRANLPANNFDRLIEWVYTICSTQWSGPLEFRVFRM